MAKGKYHEWLTEDGLLLLRKWARNGLTDLEIARNMSISKDTFYKWKARFSDFADALKKTKDMYDSEVEEALERSALGYYVWEEEWTNKWNPKTKQYELTLSKKKRVWVKPDTTAQIFWLKNRDKLHWRDKQEIQMDLEEDEYGVVAMPPVLPPEPPPEENNHTLKGD